MKKSIVKIISLLICITMSLTLFACKPGNDNTGSSGGGNSNVQNSSDAYTEFIDTYVDTINKEDISEPKTTLFMQNGVSEYKLLISESDYSGKVELKAAQEIQFFIQDAYGFKMEIVKDTDESVGDYDTSKKYISIGYTSFYKASPMNDTLDFDELGNDGYKIQTHGNLVIVNAVGNNGIVFGAYGFLERNMDYRYYAMEEWHITTEPNVYLKQMDVVSVPEFDSRYLDTATNWGDAALANIVRLRIHGSQGGRHYDGMEGGAWKGSDQSLCLQYLDCNRYQSNHGNWYTGNGQSKEGQMCLTSVLENDYTYVYSNDTTKYVRYPTQEQLTSGEVIQVDNLRPLDEMIINLIRNFIIAYPTNRVFMFGINDNSSFQCRCEQCSAEVNQILYSGQVLLLCNVIKKYLDQWQAGATTLPSGAPLPADLIVEPGSHNATRTILLSFFAYLYCLEAPVEYDTAMGTYKPVSYDAPYLCAGGDGVNGDGDDSDMNVDEDILVRIAPIESVNMHTHYDREYNEAAYQSFECWSAITHKLSVWDYGTTFSDYISPYPDWGIIQDDFKYFRAKNVTELLTQLPAHTSGTSFYALMMYLRAQLMWDMDQDVEWLIKDFFMNYYGPQAFDAMYGYFTFIRNYLQMADGSYYNADGDEIKGFINANGVKVEYHGYIYEIFTNQKYFPMVTLMQLKAFFTQAEAALNLVKTTEPKYQKYFDRVQVESLFSRYIDLKNYRSYYSNTQLAEMVDEFERIARLGNLTQFSNAGKNGVQQVVDFIANLRKSIN